MALTIGSSLRQAGERFGRAVAGMDTEGLATEAVTTGDGMTGGMVAEGMEALGPDPCDQPGLSPPLLVFDGGCVFCRHFAELSELRSGIPGLEIRDGRADQVLRQQLERRGYQLRDGAMVIDADRVLHGAEAIAWLCGRMAPSAALLQVLAPVLAKPQRAEAIYPLLLFARRLALALRGLPVDPAAEPSGPTVTGR